MGNIRITLFAFICLVLSVACSEKKKKEEAIKSFENGEALPNAFATGFKIEKSGDSYRLTIINPFQDISDSLVYMIRPEKKEDKKGLITKVGKVVTLASTHAAYLAELGKVDLIRAVSTNDYFYNEDILEKVESGVIKEVGIGQNINTEELIVLDPDIIFISGVTSKDYSEYRVLQDAGIEIIPIPEWQEHHPLGRAEWIKVFGLFSGSLDKAEEIFENVAKAYNALNGISDFDERPKVIINAPYKDTWWLPGGNSYVSVLLDDAGSDYPWQDDTSTGGLQADFEVVYHKAHDAAYWLNPGSYYSLDDLLKHDERYKEFLAFQQGNVYNNNLRIRAEGGNDYYETGTVRPNLILADLIKILHPGKLPEHQLFFYQKLK